VADDSKQLDNADPRVDNGGVAVAGRQRGTHMGFARMLATILFIVALPIALVTSNIRLLVNAPVVYDYAFDRYDAEQSTGLSRAVLDNTASALRNYFNNDEETFYETVTEDGLSGPVFNARETRHLQDVKSIMVWLNRVQVVTLVYVLAYVVAFFVWARDGSLRQLATQALAGLALGMAAVIGVGIFAAFGFESAWDHFHQLLFNNDFWRLNTRTDHLIQMFPEEFWRDMTIVLGVMCALETLLIGAVSALYLLGSRSERRHLPGTIDVKSSSTQAA
jgi:integral membrane protein (TIGR01906 family)